MAQICTYVVGKSFFPAGAWVFFCCRSLALAFAYHTLYCIMCMLCLASHWFNSLFSFSLSMRSMSRATPPANSHTHIHTNIFIKLIVYHWRDNGSNASGERSKKLHYAWSAWLCSVVGYKHTATTTKTRSEAAQKTFRTQQNVAMSFSFVLCAARIHDWLLLMLILQWSRHRFSHAL